MPNPLLSVDSLFSGYDSVAVVNDVSFDVARGEIVALVGLNGAGKTTLIKTILGLREKFSGNISFDRKKDISYLPERFEPPWFLSGYQFIEFSLKLYKVKMTRSEIDETAKDISLNCAALKNYVHRYSKGMRQKLGLLATILTACPLLIFDEPMSGLDPKARQDVKSLILKVKEQNRSVFMSTHVLADVEEICDRVAVFHDNEIIFLGTPAEMKERGQNDNLEKAFLTLVSG